MNRCWFKIGPVSMMVVQLYTINVLCLMRYFLSVFALMMMTCTVIAGLYRATFFLKPPVFMIISTSGFIVKLFFHQIFFQKLNLDLLPYFTGISDYRYLEGVLRLFHIMQKHISSLYYYLTCL